MVKENLSTAMVNEEFGLVIIHRLYKFFFFFSNYPYLYYRHKSGCSGSCSLTQILGRTLNCKMNK